MRPIQAPIHALRCAPLPHLTALLCALLAAASLRRALYGWAEAHPLECTALLMLAASGMAGVCFAAADAVARHREFRRIRSLLARKGYSERVLRVAAGSRCQRDAALAAAHHAGHRDRAAAYFRALGYRWYHVLPDAVLRDPLRLLRPSFLRASFLPGKKPREERPSTPEGRLFHNAASRSRT